MPFLSLILLALAIQLSVPRPAFADPATPAPPHVDPGSSAAPAPTDAELTRQLDALLVPLLPADQPGAAVLVARDGKAVYRKAFGLADAAQKSPLAPEAVFRLGSVTKQFTAALVMRLVERGKLHLDDEITKYLPDYPTHGQKITIENLLTHTSGIANYTALPAWQPRMNESLSHDQLIALFRDEPLAFTPGTRFSYSNSNYYLLGVIIETVTGHSYAENLQAEIFGPLGMTHSGYGKDEPSFPGEAHGHTKDGEAVRPCAPLSMTQPFAAGAIVSNVDDLLKWDEGLSGGKVLAPESMKRTFGPYTLADGTASKYGYGWMMGDYEGHAMQFHNGGINGFVSYVCRLPGDHAYIAMLVNTDAPSFDGNDLAARLVGIVVGRPRPEPAARVTITLAPEQLDACVGRYELAPSFVIAVTRDGAGLKAQATGQPAFEIFPESPTRFFLKVVDAQVELIPGGDGKMASMILHQGGHDMPGNRIAE